MVGSGVFSSVGLGIPLWRVRFTWSFLAFYCASEPLQLGKKELSLLFKIRTERKEFFVNEINFKSRMCSVGVQNKRSHHSFIYFHFLRF